MIAERAQQWDFSFTAIESQQAYEAVQMAMQLLKENADDFPVGYLPPSDSQRAAVAIRIHCDFIGQKKDSMKKQSLNLMNRIVTQYPVK